MKTLDTEIHRTFFNICLFSVCLSALLRESLCNRDSLSSYDFRLNLFRADAEGAGAFGGCGAVGDFQFAIDAAQVVFDSIFRDKQTLGDLFIARPADDLAQYVEFAPGQVLTTLWDEQPLGVGIVAVGLQFGQQAASVIGLQRVIDCHFQQWDHDLPFARDPDAAVIAHALIEHGTHLGERLFRPLPLEVKVGQQQLRFRVQGNERPLLLILQRALKRFFRFAILPIADMDQSVKLHCV